MDRELDTHCDEIDVWIITMASALLHALFAGKPHCLAAAVALAGDEVARAVTVYSAERLARRGPM
jgi:hypothetical protein